MIEEFESEVLSDADSRYGEFIDRLLDTCVVSGLFSSEEERELRELLLRRGQLPRLITIQKRISYTRDPELEDLFVRFITLRSRCGLIKTGGGVHAVRDMTPQEKGRTLRELRDVVSSLKHKLWTLPNYNWKQGKPYWYQN